MIDLLDLVRSIAAAAERAAENKNYPVPCGQSSLLLDSVRQACVERGYTAGGLAVPGVPVESAPAGTAVATPQPVIGRLMDQISALPVLWGLNEPGALLRNSDVLRVLVAAGREQAALAAPQVAADERALSLLYGIGRTIIGLRDGWGDKNDAAEAIANIAEVKSALAAAPAQVQEPVVELFAEKLAREMREGTAVFVSAEAAPAQPVAAPYGCDCDDGLVWKEGCTSPCLKCQDVTDDPAAPVAHGDATTHTAQIGTTSHLIGEQIFNLATPYFLWTKDGAACDGWQHATAGVVGMPSLLSFARSLTDAINTKAAS